MRPLKPSLPGGARKSPGQPFLVVGSSGVNDAEFLVAAVAEEQQLHMTPEGKL